MKVTSERRGGVAVLRYADPPMDYMTAEGAAALLAAVEAAIADDGVRALVLTGRSGGAFVRHYDVGELSALSDRLTAAPPAAPPPPVDPPQADRPPESAFARLTDALAAAPKPVIAAINGACMGGGFEIALACDLRIAADSVESIGLPETRIGIFPGGGGTQRLPRVIGEAAALAFILQGRVVNAAEAARIGLVNETAPDALARALDIALAFEAAGAEGLAFAKRLARSALDRPLTEGLAEERRCFIEVVRTPGAVAGMRGFIGSGVGIEEH